MATPDATIAPRGKRSSTFPFLNWNMYKITYVVCVVGLAIPGCYYVVLSWYYRNSAVVNLEIVV